MTRKMLVSLGFLAIASAAIAQAGELQTVRSNRPAVNQGEVTEITVDGAGRVTLKTDKVECQLQGAQQPISLVRLLTSQPNYTVTCIDGNWETSRFVKTSMYTVSVR